VLCNRVFLVVLRSFANRAFTAARSPYSDLKSFAARAAVMILGLKQYTFYVRSGPLQA